MNKPIGFDNYRGISFTTKDGSGRAFRVVGSFVQVLDTFYRVYRGPNVAYVRRGGLVASNYAVAGIPAPATSPFSTYGNNGTSGTTTDIVVVTTEPHGFVDYESVGFQFAAANLTRFNGEFYIRVLDSHRVLILGPSGDTNWNAAALVVAAGVTNPGAMAGADTGTRVLIAEHPAVVVGPKISETSLLAEPWTQEVWVS